MRARAILRLAWRSLGRNRRRSAITVAAIAFGLALAVFFIAFADGVYAQLIDDAARMHGGHLTVEHRDYRDAPATDLMVPDAQALARRLERVPGVARTKLLVLGQGMAQSGNGAMGVAVAGVQPAVEAATSPLARHLVSGRYLADGDERLAVVGAKLADELHLTVGKKLVLSGNDVHGQLTQELVRVAGIFSLGSDDVDGHFIQVPIDFARRVYGLPAQAATEVGLVLSDPDHRDRVQAKVAALLPPALAVRTWEEVMPDLAAYVRIDGGSNLVFQGILLFLSLFTIFNTITMSVVERTREFAIQLALGTSRAALRAQVLLESALLAAVGGLAGVAIGGVVAYAFQVRGLDIRRFYKEGISVSGFAINTVVHARVRPVMLAEMGLMVVAATVLLSTVPLRRIGRIRLAEVLR